MAAVAAVRGNRRAAGRCAPFGQGAAQHGANRKARNAAAYGQPRATATTAVATTMPPATGRAAMPAGAGTARATMPGLCVGRRHSGGQQPKGEAG